MVADVGICRPVLGHVDRSRLVVAVEAQQQVVQAFRHDLPAHVGAVDVVAPHDLRPAAVRVGRDQRRGVVVHSEEVDRRGDRLQVAVVDLGHDSGPGLDHVVGIRAAKQRIEEPAVVQPVHPPRRSRILRRVAGGIGRVEVERDSDLRAR